MRKIAMTHPQTYHKSELHCENTMPTGPPAGSEYTKVEAILGKSPKTLNIKPNTSTALNSRFNSAL
jgi:hypothetical protein